MHPAKCTFLWNCCQIQLLLIIFCPCKTINFTLKMKFIVLKALHAQGEHTGKNSLNGCC